MLITNIFQCVVYVPFLHFLQILHYFDVNYHQWLATWHKIDVLSQRFSKIRCVQASLLVKLHWCVVYVVTAFLTTHTCRNFMLVLFLYASNVHVLTVHVYLNTFRRIIYQLLDNSVILLLLKNKVSRKRREIYTFIIPFLSLLKRLIYKELIALF